MNHERRPVRPPEPESRLQKKARSARSLGFYTLIPTMMGVGPLLGYLLGSSLERRFGHAPWISFGCVILGAVASVRQIILLLRRGEQAERSDSESESLKKMDPDR
jgi:F0F1-type ATP synthase assembly protein I